MSRKNNGKKWSGSVPVRRRRASALELLEKQLEKGFKNTKEGKPTPLLDKDIARIDREITTLKSRL